MIREEPIPIETHPVIPAIVDVNPAVDQINEWLTRPFVLNVWCHGALTSRSVLPRERMSWMQTTVETRGLVAHLNADGIGKFLTEVNLELGPDADLQVNEAAGLVRSALMRGDQSVWLMAPRKQVVHTVAAGDSFDRLSDQYGIPAPKLIAANPGVEQNDLLIGQQIVIPAQSSMLPAPLAPDNLKHIEIDLSTQRLYAYDGSAVVLSATISSGIPKWRTLDGIFQVLSKEDEAYNSLAHVRMPNWLTIYDLAEPGSTSNGIHALPILQSGKRLWDGYLGKPVSFGCIVMGIKDSAFIYQWADVGTPVVIHGTTPPSSLNYDNLVQAQKVAGAQ
jgi:lipoprotein-anchoring transpeptidase ErfK/SrfK